MTGARGAGAALSGRWSAVDVRTWSSKASKKGKKGAAVDEVEAEAPVQFDMTSTREMMDKAIAHLQQELAGLRAGRATPAMLDHIRASVHGEHTSLKALGTAVVKSPQLLMYTPFDPDTANTIANAIRESPLGLNPRTEGSEILISIPRPTAEMLASMKKVCRTEADEAKIAIRHARKLAMDVVKKVSAKDERHRLEKEVQKVTDGYVDKVGDIEKAKEKSIDEHSM
ncbi:ribosome recycling factor [Helicosporidium sp. ATCC 50920]|nr:ribosome recycling factor [Helicosporidium sp. ATCC 50920]|eukprot:KDD76311.1 ribosome recycling factor [Helicosporidium sp. ATCC 50920]